MTVIIPHRIADGQLVKSKPITKGTMQENNTPYTGVMVDLETMSTRNNAAITSIGAVKFWLNVRQETFTPDQLFYSTIDLASSQDYGLDIDAETVKWWLSQSKEAQAALTERVPGDLHGVLQDFSLWFPKDAYLFGNGATFDNVILRSAYTAVKVPYPLTYKQDVCYRTLNRLSDVETPPFEGTKHNALHDAIWQTKHLMAILEKTPWHHR